MPYGEGKGAEQYCSMTRTIKGVTVSVIIQADGTTSVQVLWDHDGQSKMITREPDGAWKQGTWTD